jgi:hypothetical protein
MNSPLPKGTNPRSVNTKNEPGAVDDHARSLIKEDVKRRLRARQLG